MMRDTAFTDAQVSREPAQRCISGPRRKYNRRFFCIALQNLRLASGLMRLAADANASI
jgi:hypothetical protein